MIGKKPSLFWPALLLAVLTFGVFSPILRNDFAGIWDDDKYIASNEDYNPPTLKKLVHYWVPPPKEEFFVPVLYTTWGLIVMEARSVSSAGIVTFHAWPFHALSIAAHVGSAVFAFLILFRLSRSRAAAFLGGAIFALQPVQVEAVAWASTAYTPLCGMFCLLAIWQFLIATDVDESMHSRGFAIHYAIASLAFLLAMLTKPAALSAPLMIAAIEIGLRKRPMLKMILPLGAWVLFACLIVSITRGAVPAGTVAPPYPWQRVFVAIDAVTFYLYRVISPFGLCIDYGRSWKWVLDRYYATGAIPIPNVYWLLFLLPIGLVALARRFRNRLPALNSAVGLFLAALLPTLGLAPFTFQSFSTVADRYAYLALFSVAMIVTLSVRKAPLVWTLTATVIITMGFGVLSLSRMPQWKNEWTLFESTLRRNPDSHIVSGNLSFMLTPSERLKCTLSANQLEGMGDRLMLQRRSKLASDVYSMSVQRDPIVRTYVKLAQALLQTEQPRAAHDAAMIAARLAPDDPLAKDVLNDAEQSLKK